MTADFFLSHLPVILFGVIIIPNNYLVRSTRIVLGPACLAAKFMNSQVYKHSYLPYLHHKSGRLSALRFIGHQILPAQD